jgi:hypothetical protein
MDDPVMKTLLTSAVVVLLMVWKADAQPKKALVIALDGMRGDAVEQIDAPALQSVMRGDWAPGYRGNWSLGASTVRDAVTASGPNHTSIFTGVGPLTHGVMGNNDAQMKAVRHRHFIELIEQHTEGRANTVKLVTWSPDLLMVNGADYALSETDEANARRAVAMLAGDYRDDLWSAGRDVDLMHVFFDDIDGAGHGSRFAIDEPRYVQTVQRIDGYVGLMLDALRARPTFGDEDWLVVITSDHGGYLGHHGDFEADCYTIPFLLSGRSVESGEIPGIPGNIDVTPTVLQHFGINPEGEFTARDGTVYRLEGEALGSTRKPEASSATPPVVRLDAASLDRLAQTRLPASGPLSVVIRVRVIGVPERPVALLANKPIDTPAANGLAIMLEPVKDKPDLIDVAASLSDARGAMPDLMSSDASAQVLRIGRNQIVRPGSTHTIALVLDRDANATLYTSIADGRLAAIGNDARRLGAIDTNVPLSVGEDPSFEIESVIVFDRVLDPLELKALTR